MTQDYLDELTVNIRQADTVSPATDQSRPLIPLENAPALKYQLQNIQQLQQFSQYPNPLLNACAEALALCVSVQRMSRPDDMHRFRQGLVNAITDLKQRIAGLDYPASVADKTCFLFCIVLDEFILNCDWNEECRWENQTLLSELFGMRDGGEQFYAVVEKALSQPNLLVDMLEVIYVLLKIGFKGQYHLQGQKHIDGIYYKIESVLRDTQAPSLQIPLHTEKPARPRRSPRPGGQMPFLWLAVLFMFAIAATWVGLSFWYKDTYAARTEGFSKLAEYTDKLQKRHDDNVVVYVSTDDELKPVAAPVPKPPPQPVSKPAPAGATPVWVVQVGSFLRPADAQSRVDKYNFSARGSVIQHWKGRYRILLPTASRTAALSLMKTVREEGVSDAFIFRSTGIGG
ncbi:type IVB secretion system protein IcmH/DotU [Aliamphritea hakodatensis]|uniref:type IVB secretion system protein IcmH/DotU n=1 Tax=Aliamphritea hakodatensis TaxID=2895352 RepID=UPI0022FD891B|nr:type IVB secretion system protein IcmH/DotU [Aliamphritea hakodatensis]